jgi:Inner membrane protein YgaP-like, transmembrane domain
MGKNMSKTDGIIRIIVAIVIAGLWYTNVISGTLLIVLAIVAAIFIITGFINICPLYSVFGIRTRNKE